MISELVAASAWIMPPGWLSSLLLSLSVPIVSPEAPAAPELAPPPSGDELEPPPSPPDGSGGVPEVPVELLPYELPELPLALNEFALFDPLDEPLSPPLPSMPRKVFASVAASALRSGTTCMLPGTALGASSCFASSFAAARRAPLDARISSELVRA